MAPYDIVMLIVLVAATIMGAWKGLVWQLASVASIVASYLVALRYREPVAAQLGFEPPWGNLIAMLILYVGTSLVIWTLFRFVKETIDRLKLREFDRQIGAIVGFAKGVLLCVVITLFAVALSKEQWRTQIIDSASGYYIAVLLDKAHPVMPDEIHEVLEPYLHSLDKRLDDPPPIELPRRAEKPDEQEESEPPEGGNLRDDLRKLFRVGEGSGHGQRR